ncbi:M28 family peptidase [Luteolibacter flavescens]|uniref:M28 family peptidase n=1 Tax=Luteolibacter flavescens TaxID=1859460 RepID=A0ABT3FLD3_9BACT|nr:M28 family peptidase [Luteolibacter flavescens]MCW1883780.1 M28 family peptidase [Luteolibacter flavescens]
MISRRISALAPRGGIADGWRVTEEESSPPTLQKRIALLLWLVPLGLVITSCIGLWLHFKAKATAAQVEQARFTTSVSDDVLRDDMQKVLGFVGERHVSSPAGIQGLNRAAAMIEGSLGPANAGYRMESIAGPDVNGSRWPILIATVRGSDEKQPALWLVAPYDSRPGSRGAEANASGVTSLMAAAHALANSKPVRPVHFAFIPHAYDGESPVMEIQQQLAERIGKAGTVLVVESTGAAGTLMISSRDAGNAALTKADGLGEVVGAEAICLEDDFDPSATLFELGLPAARVATRPVVKADEADATAPDPAIHASATRALVALIERLSDN